MLTVRNLKKVYPKSDRVAVDDISFELRPGEIFGWDKTERANPRQSNA